MKRTYLVILVILMGTVFVGSYFLIKNRLPEYFTGITDEKIETGQTLVPVQTEDENLTVENEDLTAGLYLEIISPEDGITTGAEEITVKGKTKPSAEVFINENEISADNLGNFSNKILLDQGENLIVITANDEEGNFAEKQITVIREL